MGLPSNKVASPRWLPLPISLLMFSAPRLEDAATSCLAAILISGTERNVRFNFPRPSRVEMENYTKGPIRARVFLVVGEPALIVIPSRELNCHPVQRESVGSRFDSRCDGRHTLSDFFSKPPIPWGSVG